MERRELERQIVEKEWLMFQQVQGVNGRAACQDDWTTFLIMRLSQFEGWDTDVRQRSPDLCPFLRSHEASAAKVRYRLLYQP